MIRTDQPHCFGPDLLVGVSSRSDGTMLDRAMGIHDGAQVSNRTRFCDALGVDYGDVVYQRITYGPGETYDKIATVDAGKTTRHVSEVAADALITSQPGVGLFLPVADCVATVLYDQKQQVLAVAHLGRHSSYAKLASKVVAALAAGGSDPADIAVWMSPHAQKDSYKLEWFDKTDDPDWVGYYQQKPDGFYLDLAGYNANLLQRAGVPAANIHVSAVDTMHNSNYFSHAAGDTGGRIAVVAMLRG